MLELLGLWASNSRRGNDLVTITQKTGMRFKYIASSITAGRIIGAFSLLLVNPLSVLFFVVYTLCCVSDLLDGYVARRTKTTSRFGEIFDSIADFIFVTILLFIFIPMLAWEQWILIWIGVIALIRFLSLSVGFTKYHTLAFLHTYANKATGIILVCFPVLCKLFGLTITVFMLCGIASLSAIEELIISFSSKKLDRNISGLFFINKAR